MPAIAFVTLGAAVMIWWVSQVTVAGGNYAVLVRGCIRAWCVDVIVAAIVMQTFGTSTKSRFAALAAVILGCAGILANVNRL